MAADHEYMKFEEYYIKDVKIFSIFLQTSVILLIFIL